MNAGQGKVTSTISSFKNMELLTNVFSLIGVHLHPLQPQLNLRNSTKKRPTKANLLTKATTAPTTATTAKAATTTTTFQRRRRVTTVPGLGTTSVLTSFVRRSTAPSGRSSRPASAARSARQPLRPKLSDQGRQPQRRIRLQDDPRPPLRDPSWNMMTAM